MWASVLIQQGIISNDRKIIAYLNTIKIQGQPVKKVRQQFKNHYRPQLFKLINSQPTPELRYQGLTGKVRALIERISNWIKRNGEPPVGTLAWEAKLELEKLPAIVEARQARLASAEIDADTRAQLEAEIADLEKQIEYHTRNLDAMDTNPGRGFVASEGYVELHNHLNGVLEPEELLSVAYSRKLEDGTQITDYKQYLIETHETLDKRKNGDAAKKLFERILGNRSIESMTQEEAQLLSKQLLSSESVGDRSGTRFDDVYRFRRVITKKLTREKNMPALYKQIIQKLKSQNIDYIELQGGLRNGNGYHLTEEEITKILAEAEIDVRFLRLLQSGLFGKKGSNEVEKKRNDDIVNAVERLDSSDRVREVGVDILGQEKVFHPDGMEKFESLYDQLLAKATELGRTLVLRVHVGEGNVRVRNKQKHVDEARNNVSILTHKLQKMQEAGKLDPEKVVIRYGHATHASFEDLEKIKKLGVIVEANLTSNETTGSVGSRDETQQTLLKFLYHDINTVLNTDGGGVMGTDLPSEYDLAKKGIERFKDNEIGIPDHNAKTIYYYDELPDIEGLDATEYLYLEYEHKLIPPEKKANFEFEKLKENSDYYRDNISPRIKGEKSD